MPSSNRPILVRTLVVVGLILALVAPPQIAAAARVTAGGFTSSGRVSASSVAPGAAVTITASVSSSTARSVLIDVEVFDGAGRKVLQKVWDAQPFQVGVSRSFQVTWTVPAAQAQGTYRVDVGVFKVGWGEVFHWNTGATTLRVAAGPPPTTTTTSTSTTTTAPTTTTTVPATTTTRVPATTTTTVRPTTTTSPSTTTTTSPLPTTTSPPTTTTVPPGTRFVTLPPRSPLPTDAQCAARVRRVPEIRPQNEAANGRRGHADPSQQGTYARVTGDFTGTTDEIIQWAACKWGFDEDVIRAQTAKESWWTQHAGGDLTGDVTRCPPGHGIGVDGHPGQCPESYGVQQVRFPYFVWAFNDAIDSTAYNLDVALAARRSCFEGYETWLNTVERGRQYAAGDMWGCVGMWFSGRWYTEPSVTYIGAVQAYLAERIWTKPEFIGFRG
jgi:hypothetical protein